ncbi:MAG: endonuclease domain-containing protein [Desulfomonilia bacterium]|jgi:very-short-patch-repair endonuclease
MSINRARALRKGMTDAERLLWRHLRNREVDGCKFRRQHPLGPFIVDFVCIERGLIIELDGGQHAFSLTRDEKRTRYLEAKGYRVLRFWNNDVLKEAEAVFITIQQALSTPSPRPSPPEGAREVR